MFFDALFLKHFFPRIRVKTTITTTGSEPDKERFGRRDRFSGTITTIQNGVTTIVELADQPEIDTRHASKDKSSYTLMVMATGGMRDFQKECQKKSSTAFNLLETEIETYIQTTNSHGFKTPTYQTITGKEEALYGWAASNYLLRKLPKAGIKRGLVNYLEMGGATAQIAFRSRVYKQLKKGGASHNPTLFDGKLMRVNIWGKEIDLYLRTYPLGTVSALATHETAVQHQLNWDGIDPCKPNGWVEGFVKRDVNGTPTGNGKVVEPAVGPNVFNYPTCERLLGFLLKYQIDGGDSTYPKPGRILPGSESRAGLVDLLDGSPGLAIGSQFVGGANFYYTMRSTFGRDAWDHPKDVAHNFSHFQEEVNRRANLSLTAQIQGSKKNTTDRLRKDYLGNSLFTAAWVTTVLKGFGILGGGKGINFQPYNGPIKKEIDYRPELSWTLGAAFLDACQGSDPNRTILQVVHSCEKVHDYSRGYHAITGVDRLLDSENKGNQ